MGQPLSDSAPHAIIPAYQGGSYRPCAKPRHDHPDHTGNPHFSDSSSPRSSPPGDPRHPVDSASSRI